MNDFSHVYNRKISHSLKWDQLQTVFNTDDVLPMWVADMDFKAPSVVNKAIEKRAKHGFYGYTVINDELKQKVSDWVSNQHNWSTQIDSLIFSPGVIPSINSAIEVFTNPGDKILIQTPVYTPFFNLIKSNNREIIEQELVKQDNKYEINFADFEKKIKSGVKVFILCSPHNPVGRVWRKDELEKMAEICLANDVLIFADEIHADLTLGGHKHIPIASLSKEVSNKTITFMSPTKTFNLAGLQISYIIAENKRFNAKLVAELNRQGMNMMNTFGVVALDAVYPDAKPWLSDLLKVVEDNKNYVVERLERETPLKVIDAEGTYLLWIDCEALGLSEEKLNDFFIKEAKVGLNRGSSYGKPGNQFMRMNIACPKELITEGTDRIINAINKKITS
ncbi:MAG TPA: MalY/PatB family protein [Pseudogracilibacillus sp.]|nr:MalY/PatB family protein [Pseudogracilibacillus sp.]